MASYPLSDRELVGSAEDGLRASYPTPVPEDLRGLLDPNLGDGTGLLFQEYHQVADVSAIERGPFGVSGRGPARGGLGSTHLSVGYGTPDASPLPQLLSPDYTVVQSPSMASEILYDGICSPSPAPVTAMMYPGMGVVDLRRHSRTLHHPRSHEYVNPAEISPGPPFRYGSQSAPVAYGGFEYQQSQGSSLPLGADDIQGAQPFFVATDYVHDGMPGQDPAFSQRGGVWQPAGTHHLSRVEPCGEGLVPIARTPPERLIRCRACGSSFHSDEKLSEHLQSDACKAYPCLFRFAGCTTKCKSKNEWKRHTNSKHVHLECYICTCTEGGCAESRIHSAQEGRPLPPTFPRFGRVFNRKDLFKEHLGRLEDKRSKTKTKFPRAQLEARAEEALHHRIELPQHMECFVEGCGDVYGGQSAWSDFLEHVAGKHMKLASGPGAQPVTPRGREGVMLTDFGVSAGFLAKTESGWRLAEPLEGIKPSPEKKKNGSKKAHDKQVSLRGRRAKR